MLACNLPEDIVIDILSRLPVKSLLRFKSVSKPWLSLITNSRFIYLHHNRASLNPNSESFIVHIFQCKSPNHVISLLHNTLLHSPMNLNHPYPNFNFPSQLDVVGSCNGLVCLSNPPNGVMLWNPATKEFKDISDHNLNVVDKTGEVSLGIGFDPKTKDYKVVRIVWLNCTENVPVQVQVYSVNANSWREIKVDLQFHTSLNCGAIVKGVPYWVAMKEWCDPSEMFLLSFDVQNDKFQKISLPSNWVRTVDYKGSLALIVSSRIGDENIHCGVWTMDDERGDKSSWSEKFTIESVPEMKRLVGCLRNGVIVAEKSGKSLFLYDREKKENKDVRIAADARAFGIYNYTESLVSIRGSKLDC